MGTENDPLKVGDRVRVTTKDLREFGMTGEVTAAAPRGACRVDFGEGFDTRVFHCSHLQPVTPAQEPSGPVKSDGGSTSYYAIPDGAVDLLDLIDHKCMTFGVGNVFKACYRLGEKDGTDAEYDLNKIIFFAQREKEKLRKKGPKGR